MPKLVQILDDINDDAIEPIKLEWCERTIVFRKPHAGVIALDGWRYGTLMVHSTWINPRAKPVTITHWPSKLTIARLENANEAIVQTEWLWGKCTMAWAGDDVNKQLIPAEVMQWLKEHQR